MYFSWQPVFSGVFQRVHGKTTAGTQKRKDVNQQRARFRGNGISG